MSWYEDWPKWQLVRICDKIFQFVFGFHFSFNNILPFQFIVQQRDSITRCSIFLFLSSIFDCVVRVCECVCVSVNTQKQWPFFSYIKNNCVHFIHTHTKIPLLVLWVYIGSIPTYCVIWSFIVNTLNMDSIQMLDIFLCSYIKRGRCRHYFFCLPCPVQRVLFRRETDK